MKFNKGTLNHLLATASIVVSGAAFADFDPPRGRDVEAGAANCHIGTYPSISKPGSYAALCNVMSDAEKCLALIKRQFLFVNDEVEVRPVREEGIEAGRAQYCLDVLKRDLEIQ